MYENMRVGMMLMSFGDDFLINNMAKFHILCLKFKTEICKYQTWKSCMKRCVALKKCQILKNLRKT